MFAPANDPELTLLAVGVGQNEKPSGLQSGDQEPQRLFNLPTRLAGERGDIEQ